MSGFEVAGILLGAIPLVISALEHYESALDPAIAFVKWQRELSTAIWKLWIQHTFYVQSIRLLLTPIATELELQDMMGDSNHELWNTEEMAGSLQVRLGDAYKAYIEIIRQIEAVTKSLAERLDIEGADKINQQGLEAIVFANRPIKKHGVLKFQFSKRVKFTMKKQKVKKLLQNLEDYNAKLDTFANKAEKLEEPYKAERKSKFVLPLSLVQGNAKKLYEGLSRSWCSAHSSHSAGLLLEPRLIIERQKRIQSHKQRHSVEQCDTHCFGISLLQNPSPKKWLDVEFRVVEDSSIGQRSIRSTVQVVISSPPSKSSSSTPYADPSRLQLVTNLCAIIQQPTYPNIGFCIDGSGHLRGAYPAQPRALTYVENGVSLEDLLTGKRCRFSKEEIYSLSITLTSSLLQLSPTPWLKKSWNKTDIIFLRAKDISTSLVDVKHPYLTREHTPSNVALIRHNAAPGNDCSKLLGLAVLLVEVSAEQPIEHLWRPEYLGPNNQPNEITNLQAVQRWLEEQAQRGDLSYGFSSAIRHCLRSSVDPTASLRNLEFRRTVEEQVLAPLVEEMSFYLHGPPTC